MIRKSSQTSRRKRGCVSLQNSPGGAMPKEVGIEELLVSEAVSESTSDVRLQQDIEKKTLLETEEKCPPLKCLDFGIEDYLSRVTGTVCQDEEQEEEEVTSEHSFLLDATPPDMTEAADDLTPTSTIGPRIESNANLISSAADSNPLSPPATTDDMGENLEEQKSPSNVHPQCHFHMQLVPGLAVFPCCQDLLEPMTKAQAPAKEAVKVEEEDVGTDDDDEEDDGVEEPPMSDLERRVQVLRLRTRLRKQDTNACLMAPPEFRIQESVPP